MSDLIGQTIGSYRIEGLLGSGGMGQVYRARHILLDRAAALKVMHDNLARDPSFQARFLQEAKAIAALQHPNIVEIYDFGEQAGRYYLVLELLTDGSLRTLLQRRTQTNQAWPLTFGLNLLRQAADGLDYAHRQGMIHRDIKPDNMLLRRPTGVTDPHRLILKLTDFGLARLAEGTLMTATGTAMGTPAYMSPEQCQGLHLDGRSDIYALGIVCYEVTTGYLPFAPKTLSEAIYKHIHEAPPSPRQARPDLPEALEAIILRCLAKRPEERFASAAELSGVLQQLLDHPVPALTEPTVIAVPPGAPQVSPPASPSRAGTVAMLPTTDTPPLISSLPGASALPRLQVLDDGLQVLRAVDVTSAGLTIGRLSTNSIALNDEAVSREHVRVDWNGQQVMVTDLGSSNGTLLSGNRLVPQVAQIWAWRELLRLGPFWLRLEPPNSPTASPDTFLQGLLSSAEGAAATRTGLPTIMQTNTGSGRIAVVADQAELSLTPGQPAVARVTIANLGSTVDHFTLTAEGIPQVWVQSQPQEVQLNPQMHLPVALSILAPRAPDSRAGEYMVTLRARSRQSPAESSVAIVRWTVQPFVASSLAVKPKKVSARRQASYQVTLSNNGNIPATYRLSASDDEQALSYQFSPAQAPLDIGQTANVELNVSGRQRLIGTAQPRAVTIQADLGRGEPPQSIGAQFVHLALIPVWVPPVALAVLVALCLLLYNLLVQPPAFAAVSTFDPRDPRPGQPVTVRWEVSRASSITIQPGNQPAISGIDPNRGEYTFKEGFVGPTTIKVIASNQFGSSEQAVSIGVVAIAPTATVTPTPTPEPGAPVAKFAVDQSQVDLGNPVTLTWEVTDAESVTIDQFGTVDTKGQVQDTPQANTVYKLTAVGKSGKTTIKVVQVVVVNTAATAQVITSQTEQAAGATTQAAEQQAAQAAAQQTAQAAEQQAAQAAAQQTAQAAEQQTVAAIAAAETAAAIAAAQTAEVDRQIREEQARQQTAVAQTATAVAVAAAQQTAQAATQTAEAKAALGEDCIGFDPQRAEVQQVGSRWKIVVGRIWLMDFGSSEAEARASLAIIQHYGMNDQCFVGRPDPSMEYFLVNKQAPAGGRAGEDCVSFNPDTIDAVNQNGKWYLLDGNHSVLYFADQEGEARKALAIIRAYRFQHFCFVGRPDPSMEYFRR